LTSVFKDAGIIAADDTIDSETKEVILSCGSGVTASVIAAALEECDITSNSKVYDGSWTEYGSKDKSFPIEN
jgi:thiosulfate/3-mercaptopyruvate sulfurtransferase